MVGLRLLRLGGSRHEGEPRYFPCCSLHDGTLAAAGLSAVFAATCVGFMAFQLHQVSRFFSKHQTDQWNMTPGPVEISYYDKNGRRVNIHEYVFMLSQASTEKALCSAALAAATLLLGCCVVLLRAAMEKRRLLFLPWLISMVLVYATATAVILYNCTVYGFGGVNNILLLTWIVLGFLQVHCGRCVFQYYRYLRQPRARSGVAVFDATNTGPVYAISGSSGPSHGPIEVTLTPPPYDEINQPRNNKCFFNAQDIPKEKPPEYSVQ